MKDNEKTSETLARYIREFAPQLFAQYGWKVGLAGVAVIAILVYLSVQYFGG